MDVAGVIVYMTDQGGPAEPRLRNLAATWSWTGGPKARTIRATFPTQSGGDVSWRNLGRG